MEQSSALAEPIISVLEVIRPFRADDGHKGTFLILRIAGLEQSLALRLVNRKYRSLQNWCATDEDFKLIEGQIEVFAQKFGGEARVIRTALLDISVVETGISIFRRILSKQPITDGMWSYAVKMAGLRVPMMGAQHETESPWERLANSIKTTLSQRELTVIQNPDGVQSVTAKEIVLEPSTEQKQVTNDIVRRMIEQAGVS